MLIVTEIKTKEVDRDKWEVRQCQLNTHPNRAGNALEIDSYTREMIYGRVFVNINGKRFCIGMSEQVQNAIGLPMDCFEKLNLEIDLLEVDNTQLRKGVDRLWKKLEVFDTMTFWQKIKFLFKEKP